MSKLLSQEASALSVSRRSIPAGIVAPVGLVPRLHAARGVDPANPAPLGLSGLLSPSGLPDIERAAERIATAVEHGERILVVGDFDADGATSVALAMRVFTAFGAAPRFLVPNRFEYGYGLSPEIVDLALTQSPQVIITVDNGVSSVSGVERANRSGVDVIITDHHLPGERLPDAYAIVNPNLDECGFPSKAMAGVGVIYYLLSVVRRQLKKRGWFATRAMPNLADYLDLVALGTVADVVPLDHNNRILVGQGLLRMRAGRACFGIQALVTIAKRNAAKLTASDLGYAIGPRLNAAGRLDDMSIGIRCLLADSLRQARSLAVALDELNQTRRELQQTMVADAELLVAQYSATSVNERVGICVFEPSWHQGVVGIVAGRLKDKLNRPVIAFAEAGEAAPDELKGSARSLAELHIRDTLDAIATRYPGLVVKFGGHAMAAGLAIKRVHFKRFANAFDAEVRVRLPESALDAVVVTDGELDRSELHLHNAYAIEQGGPWGQGFPEPSFHGEFDVVSERVVGQGHLKLVVRVGDSLFDAIAFNTPVSQAKRVLLVYRLAENDYGAQPTLQLMVEHLAPLA